MEDQVRVMGYLGPVLDTPDGRGQIRHDSGLYTSALAFHSDLMFSPEPILGISLHALEVGDTSTRFADARLIQRLDPELRRRIDGRDALHVFALDLAARNRDADVNSIYPPLRIPSSGTIRSPAHRSCSCAATRRTRSSVWRRRERGAPLGPVRRALDSSHVFEHTWRVGDVVLLDNLAVQHGRAEYRRRSSARAPARRARTRGIAEQHPELADHYG